MGSTVKEGQHAESTESCKSKRGAEMPEELAIPWRYGMEYELQVQLEDMSTGDVRVVPVDVQDNDFLKLFKDSPIALGQAVEAGVLPCNLSNHCVTLFIQPEFLKDQPFTLDMENIEIRNTYHHQTIDSCLRELNELVDYVGETLSKYLPSNLRFSLMLPQVLYSIPKEYKTRKELKRGLYMFRDLRCTKHLSMSYGSDGATLHNANKLLTSLYTGVQDCMCHYYGAKDSPNFIINSPVLQYKWHRKGVSRDLFCALVEGSLDTAELYFAAPCPKRPDKPKSRVHVQLPYSFKKYNKVLDGTLTIQDYENTEQILLGHSSKTVLRGKRPWIRKTSLV